MKPFKIITWNINSVRLRLPLVEQLLDHEAPDVLCLQETKCPDDKFPDAALRKCGYPHIAKFGQKGYHGVATLSRHPFKSSFSRDFCAKGDARHIAVDLSVGPGLRIHNFYVPAGGDEPDPAINPKFEHKLRFVDEMKAWIGGEEAARPAILVGDLNIAPYESDVWSHKQLLKVVSHTPVETEALEAIRETGNWIDTQRHLIPEPEPVFTWWSYRSGNWEVANKGRRLDHIWASQSLSGTIAATRVLKHARGWDRPSDHAPVVTEFTF
ncbi:MAG: exodeoxyribonuclease III [Rhizobiales bacterium]|nr:exodeoxyribonuclease III [Hyphomicrobiales bacterium]